MKSFISWSKKVLFQFVAGFVAVQSGGVSSGTTNRGLGHHGAKRTYDALSLESAEKYLSNGPPSVGIAHYKPSGHLKAVQNVEK